MHGPADGRPWNPRWLSADRHGEDARWGQEQRVDP